MVHGGAGNVRDDEQVYARTAEAGLSQALADGGEILAAGGAALDAACAAVAALEDCEVFGLLTCNGLGTTTVQGDFRSTRFESEVYLYGSQSLGMDLEFEDCTFDRLFLATISGALSTKGADLTVRRSRFRWGARFVSFSVGVLQFNVESCLVVKENGGFTEGIRVLGGPVGDFSNLTVTGFQTGIQGRPSVSWHNMLLYGNGQDLDDVAANEIEFSLIADGTHDGLNGNFSGTPHLDADYALYACSPGIDAGINTAPGLGATDLHGDPRFQDNDADFAFQVNVGAVESSGSAPASAVVANGTGQNPLAYIDTSLPTVGATYSSFISLAPATFLSVVAFDAPSQPVTSPSWFGELLIQIGTNTLFNFGLGPHQQPIPNDCNLIGLDIRSQGFRIDSFQGVVSTHCLNAIDLTVGT